MRSSGAVGISTGDEAVFLRVEEGRPLDGVAYDPAARRWREVAPAPLRSRYGGAEVWTGRELVVFGGGARGSAAASTGAVYDPRTDRWRRIARAPVSLNAASAAWTGRDVIVFGSLLDNRNRAATSTAIGAAYDPRRDRWRPLPASRLSPQATSAVWVDDRFVAWDYDVHFQQYDLRRDSWSAPAAMPLDAGECYPSSVVVRHLIFAFYCGQVAVFDPSTSRWRELHGGLADAGVWSDAYDRYLELWRFADLVSATNSVYLFAESITLNAKGVACYGCSGARSSLWAYRAPAGGLPKSTPTVSAATAYHVADDFMAARARGARPAIDRLITPIAAAAFGPSGDVGEPLLAGTSWHVSRPVAVPGRQGVYNVGVDLTLKGKVGDDIGREQVHETLRIAPGRTVSGRDASLAITNVTPE
jgi:hypothetical protein